MRKSPIFGGRLSREEGVIIPENSIDSYMVNSGSSQSSRSHQTSECSTLTPHMPILSSLGASVLDGPMYPKLVLQPVRKKSSIFNKIRDKLRPGSLVTSSDDIGKSSTTPSSPKPNTGIAEMLMQAHSGTSFLNPDLTDMLFKSAAVTSVPKNVTGDHDVQECSSDLYQQQQAFSHQSYNTNPKKQSAEDNNEGGAGGIVASEEIASELKMAFTEYSGGEDSIWAREVGYLLRTLGQNPTEDEINNLICEAGCDWEGYLNANDFVSVALVAMQKQADMKDDIKAAFDVFDRDGDGKISQPELKKAMQNFGHSFTDEECKEMFVQADLNSDGIIDWPEFVAMMAPDETATKADD